MFNEPTSVFYHCDTLTKIEVCGGKNDLQSLLTFISADESTKMAANTKSFIFQWKF